MSTCVEVGDDCFVRPVAIRVSHISAVAVLKQFGIKSRVRRPRKWMRADPNLAVLTFDELVVRYLIFDLTVVIAAIGAFVSYRALRKRRAAQAA